MWGLLRAGEPDRRSRQGAALAALALLLTGIGGTSALQAQGTVPISGDENRTESASRVDDPARKTVAYASKVGLWTVADYDFSHPAFDTDWRKGLVLFGEETIALHLVPHKTPTRSGNQYAGASIRQADATGFGRYSATIQPARGAGLVTGFFTYTGPAYGTRHDEIDIEFLGKDTRRIHLAWFRDGVLQTRWIALGFDAADQPRRYAFDWHPDRIRWYVDGKLIFEISGSSNDLPSVPGRLFANIWAADPSLSAWAGFAEPDLSATAVFRDLSFTPMDPTGRTGRTVASTMTGTTAPVVHRLP